MATTNENLKAAFAGESQANQKYLAFAKVAEKAGFSNIAKLFRTTAQAESIHAEGLLNLFILKHLKQDLKQGGESVASRLHGAKLSSEKI